MLQFLFVLFYTSMNCHNISELCVFYFNAACSMFLQLTGWIPVHVCGNSSSSISLRFWYPNNSNNIQLLPGHFMACPFDSNGKVNSPSTLCASYPVHIALTWHKNTMKDCIRGFVCIRLKNVHFFMLIPSQRTSKRKR